MTRIPLAKDLFDLSDEVALVTGASSGLGDRFARVLAAHGAKVALAARRIDRLRSLEADIAAHGGTALALALDIAEPAQIPKAFDAAAEALGPVTILVNNAGVSGQKRALDLSAEDWRQVLDVNLDGVWFTAQEAARRMVAAGKPGSIINIASVLGFRVAPTLAAYAVAKAAVVQLTGALAVELARNHIRVNGIAPGYILTEINRDYFMTPAGEAMKNSIPQRRIGDPGDLDGTLLLLASRQASGFMTGTTVVVDGGQLLSLG
jgi:3-oxoacyl-[acyl-carrier protein] reductase